MALPGSVSYSGEKSWRARLSASTSWRIGSLTFSSKSGLRGRNHSRLLLRARPRKNCRASGGKPGKGEGTIASVGKLSHIRRFCREIPHVQYSIRINDQWRICFEWPDGSTGPSNVEIVDYH